MRTKGEKRFEDLLLTCLFPKGVPVAHLEHLAKCQYEETLRAIHEGSKAIAKHHGMKLMDDIDDPADEG